MLVWTSQIRYLEHVLAEKNLFEPLFAHRMTMQQVVFRARRVLRYEMLPIVEAEIAHSSAREDLRQLQISTSQALDHLITFLYHVFRDGGGPTTISASKLRNPSGEKNEKILSNRTGQLLNKMLQQGVFASVFVDDHFQFDDARKAISDGMSNSRTDVTHSNDFLDSRGNVKIPMWLREWEKDAEKRAAMDLTNVFDHSDSGVEEFFRGKPMVAGAFLRCHGLAQEMAKFILVVEKAHRLAGQGGDLLVYGVANAQVNAMLHTYENLAQAVRTNVDRLNQIAEIHFEKLVNQNQARDSSSKWIKHFKKVSFVIQQLNEDLELADAAALHVRGQANALTLYERMEKVKSETENFVAQAESYSKHVAGVLGIQYQAPQMPVVVPLPSHLDLYAADQTYGEISAYGQSKTPLMISAAPVNPLAAAYRANPNQQLAMVRSASANSNDGEIPTEVFMSRAGVTDNTVDRVFIRLNPHITHIALEDNRLTASGGLMLFEHVNRYCPTVTSISLYKNNLGPEGARALGAALTRPNATLTRLDLNSNDLRDDGAQYLILGLLANRTLTQLDIGYNDISDKGIVDLPMVLEAEDSVLRILKMSGNRFTAKSLVPIYEIFQRETKLIDIDIGDPTDSVPPAIAEKFKEIAFPRKRAYTVARQQELEAARAKELEPQLKRIEIGAVPLLKGRGIRVKSGTPTPSSAPNSSVVVEELDDEASMAQNGANGVAVRQIANGVQNGVGVGGYDMEGDEYNYEDEERQYVREDFYDLARVIRLLVPHCKTKEYGCVPKKALRKAFETFAYGCKLPDVRITLEEYYDAARAFGVVEIREIKKKGKPSKIGLAVTEPWLVYDIPRPDNIKACTPRAWKLFLDVCIEKRKEAHKRASQKTLAKKVRPQLQTESEEVLDAMIELALYSGTLLWDVSSGKYIPNMDEKRYKIDRAVCPDIGTWPSLADPSKTQINASKYTANAHNLSLATGLATKKAKASSSSSDTGAVIKK